MSDSNRPREEIQKFAGRMETNIKSVEPEGQHWTNSTFGLLLDKMKKQVEFLERDLVNGHYGYVQDKAANVAGYAMMISDKIDKL